MKTIKMRLLVAVHTLLIAAITAASCHWSEARADDIDLYFTPEGSGSGTPNALFFFDNSASMQSLTFNNGLIPDAGLTISKADALKAVFRDLMDTLTGVDVGLATFNGRGASIVEPIRPLDAPGLGASLVSAQVNRSTDDFSADAPFGSAGEFFDGFSDTATNTPLAAVYQLESLAHHDPILHIVGKAGGGEADIKEVELIGEVLTAQIDATPANAMIIDPTSLMAQGVPYTPFGNYMPSGSHQATQSYVRFNFKDLEDTVLMTNPMLAAMRNGCILRSYIEFESTGDIFDPENETRLNIFATPLSATSTVSNTQPSSLPTSGSLATALLAHLDKDEIGEPNADAEPLAWDAVDTAEQILTPDLSDLLQSGLQHPAFADAVDNDYMTFAIDPRTEYDSATMSYSLPTDYLITPHPTRQVFANASQSVLKPRLVIRYSDSACRAPSNISSRMVLGAIFRDLRVPRGAAIDDARLHLTPANDYLLDRDVRINIYAARVTDPDNFDLQNPFVNASALNNAVSGITWIDPGRATRELSATEMTVRTSETQWVAQRNATSPDISSIIQTIVNASSWCGGDNILVLVEPQTLDAMTIAAGVNSSDSTAPKIDPVPDAQITHEQARHFHTFDSSPAYAPRLDIQYGAVADANNACNIYERRFITTDRAGSQQTSNCNASTHSSYFNNNPNTRMLMRNQRVFFMRFAELDIPAGAEVLEARWLLSNYRTNWSTAATHPRELTIYAHTPPTAADIRTTPPGSGSTKGSPSVCLAEYMLANEASAPVVWDLGTDDWTDENDPLYGRTGHVLRSSDDLKDQVQAALDAPAWSSDATRDPDVFLMMHANSSHTGPAAELRAISTATPTIFRPGITEEINQLFVRWKSDILDADAPLSHREKLVDTVERTEYQNNSTPYFAALQESISYFRHDPVTWGRRRAPASDLNSRLPSSSAAELRSIRVSSEHTHDGSITRPAGCTGFLSSADCFDSTVSTGARYQIGDAQAPCEPNVIVFLTDGLSFGYGDYARTEIEAPLTDTDNPLNPAWVDPNLLDNYRTAFETWADGLTTLECLGSCPVIDPTSYFWSPYQSALQDYFNAEYEYLAKVSRYAASDSFTAPNNPNNRSPIRTYTVGFETGSEAAGLLQAIADQGGGQFLNASDPSALLTGLRQIFTSISALGSSASAPALTINAFNSLFTLDEIYISMFDPSTEVDIWEGNVKKYRLRDTCEGVTDDDGDPDPNCVVGQLLDVNDEPVLEENSTQVRADARSLWSTANDGNNHDEGGAALVMQGQANYDAATRNFTDGSGTVAGEDLSAETDNQLTVANATMSELNPALGADATYSGSDLVEWWLGVDKFDEDNKPSTTKRWPIQDSLHSGILPIIFGEDTTGSEPEPILKLVTTTNAGEIRLINGKTGEQEWRYIPRKHLSKAIGVADPSQADISSNPNSNRVYGIDGPLDVMILDCNGNGTIESDATASGCTAGVDEVTQDRVFVFAAERRGGSAIHAIELEPDASVTDADDTDKITPKFLWSIDNTTMGYSQLGQTWSKPVPARIYYKESNLGGSAGSRLVVIFAGGYDTVNDNVFDPNYPNATEATGPGLGGTSLYFADMFTGDCLVHIGLTKEAMGCGTSAAFADMTYSIASSPGLLNSDLQATTPSRRGVDRVYFGDLGGQVIRVDLDAANVASADDYAVAEKIGDFGQDAGGSDQKNQRQFYTSPIIVPVRGDYTYSNNDPNYDLVILASGTRPFPRSEGTQDRAYVFRDLNADSIFGTATVTALKETNLFDASTTLPTSADLRANSGFYFNFDPANELVGEKVISQGAVLAGNWFFTTFSPEDVRRPGLCPLGRGIGRFYAVNILDAQPAFDQNQDSQLDITDRSSVVGYGLVSDIATAFLRGGTALLVNTSQGTRTLDTGGSLSNLDIPVVQSRREW